MINWDQLSKIGNSKIVKLTILVPIFGYLILFNDSIVNYLTLSSSALQIGLETNPTEFTFSKLHFIYYGLTFLGISSLIFSLIAPTEVTTFPTKQLYFSNSLKFITEEKIKHIQDKLTNKPNPLLLFLKHRPTDSHEVWQDHNKNDIIEVLERQYDELNSKHPIIRTIVSGFYIIGGVTLLVPSGQMFIKISKIIFAG